MNKLLEQVTARRRALGIRSLPADGSALWGLALSGGGIRSATFCFGLLRSLARNRLLLRFDLLSTVSGGGYIGSMLGRLFSRGTRRTDMFRVQQALGEIQAGWFVWWLRANGRYLIPRGMRDTLFVAALFFRNLVAIHFEFALIVLAVTLVLDVVILHAWQGLAALGAAASDPVFALLQDLPGWAPLWIPVVWLALPLVFMVGAWRAAAYWAIPWVDETPRPWLIAAWVGSLALTWGLCWWYLQFEGSHRPVGQVLRSTLLVITIALLALWLAAMPVAANFLWRSKDEGGPRAEAARTYVTRALAKTFELFSAIVVVGLIDRCAWFLAFELEPLTETGQGVAGLWLGIAAAVIRAVLPLASKLLPSSPGTSVVLAVGRLLGYALVFLLCVWWASLAHKMVLGALFTPEGLSYGSGWMACLMLAVPVLGFLLLTGQNVEFLNVSSLHAFYKARIVRSYLGAANGARFSSDAAVPPLTALGRVPQVLRTDHKIASVDAVHADDDIALDAYRPQAQGGPIHILNVCINQTRDPRGGLFNQDRRGLALSVASGGLRKASQGEWEDLIGPGALSLGNWAAISGAAVAPGLGGRTRGGISALATFAGVRLGYWWDRSARTGCTTTPYRLGAKSRGVLNETFGVFKGTDKDDWFLTDGGHFENTAAYVLLAERAQVIVIADCGADPQYRFEDLENLVRKARIDLQAEILFQKPKVSKTAAAAAAAPRRFRTARPAAPTAPRPAALERFGALDDLESATSSACLALAKVQYADAGASTGILIVIKPNVCAGLPVDLMNFKRQYAEFPQQATADQFFSEAQWESYFHLGSFLGQHLDRVFIEALLANADAWFEDDECSPFVAAKAAAPAAGASTPAGNGRVGTRIATAASGVTAVGATLSLSAAATVGVAAWQAIEATKSSYTRQSTDERSAVKELTELWTKAAGAKEDEKPAAANTLAAALLRTADSLCPAGGADWFARSDLAVRIDSAGRELCAAIPGDKPAACGALLNAAQGRDASSRATCLAPGPEVISVKPPPRYWIYDYTGAGNATNAHPCDPVVAQREDAQRQALKMGVLPRPECSFTGRFSGLLDSLPPPAAAASPGSPASVGGPCSDITLFRQIYRPEQRATAEGYAADWGRLGAKLAPIEDVVATAHSRGFASPPVVSKTTVRFHDLDAVMCARALAGAVKQGDWPVEPLPARYRPRARTVEVWFAPPPPAPPSQPAAAAPPSVKAAPPPVRESQTPK